MIIPTNEEEPLVTAETCAHRLRISYSMFLSKRKPWGVKPIRLGHRTVRYLWSQVLKAAQDHGFFTNQDPEGDEDETS